APGRPNRPADRRAPRQPAVRARQIPGPTKFCVQSRTCVVSLHQWLGGERLLPPPQSRQTGAEMLDGNLEVARGFLRKTCGIALAACPAPVFPRAGQPATLSASMTAAAAGKVGGRIRGADE